MTGLRILEPDRLLAGRVAPGVPDRDHFHSDKRPELFVIGVIERFGERVRPSL